MSTPQAATERGIGQHGTEEPLDSQLAALRERVRSLEQANREMEREVVQHRMAEELARAQTRMLIRSLGILAAESNLDKFLGHVLKVTVQQLNCVGGTLWFPDPLTGSIRLHLEYLDARIIPAAESHHPAVLRPLPVGGRGVSTFPTDRPETYVLSVEVAGHAGREPRLHQLAGRAHAADRPDAAGQGNRGLDLRAQQQERSRRPGEQDPPGRGARRTRPRWRCRWPGSASRRARPPCSGSATASRARSTTRWRRASPAWWSTWRRPAARCASSNVELALEHIEHARGLAQAGLDEARLSVRALRPDPLQQADLSQALQAQIGRMAASGTLARFTTLGETRGAAARSAGRAPPDRAGMHHQRDEARPGAARRGGARLRPGRWCL